jgi:hypothetical protein
MTPHQLPSETPWSRRKFGEKDSNLQLLPEERNSSSFPTDSIANAWTQRRFSSTISRMESAFRAAVLTYLFGALLSGIVFLFVDIRNNLTYGRISLLHSLARLPIVLFGGPVYLGVLIYLAIANRK